MRAACWGFQKGNTLGSGWRGKVKSYKPGHIKAVITICLRLSTNEDWGDDLICETDQKNGLHSETSCILYIKLICTHPKKVNYTILPHWFDSDDSAKEISFNWSEYFWKTWLPVYRVLGIRDMDAHRIFFSAHQPCLVKANQTLGGFGLVWTESGASGASKEVVSDRKNTLERIITGENRTSLCKQTIYVSFPVRRR